MARRLFFSRHVRDRMLAFHLEVSDVRDALDSAEVVEDYDDDDGQLVLGRSGIQALHVVIRALDELTFVITVYVPDPGRWDPSFRRRMSP